MNFNLGKWEQSKLLIQNSLIADYIPKTDIYSPENLDDFLTLYPSVYVKHNSAGQGRAIFKVYKEKGYYCYNGFTIHGKSVDNCVTSLEDFHQILHPFAKLGRSSGIYIVQEGIDSVTQNGQPISFRVHVQLLKGEWIIGGIYGKLGTPETNENGIVNAYRGATVKTVNEILNLYVNMNVDEKIEVIRRLEKIAKLSAQVIYSHFPRRDYGLDFGLDPNYRPVLFEVNTSPGIGGFAKIENKTIWKRIVDIRKKQNGEG